MEALQLTVPDALALGYGLIALIAIALGLAIGLLVKCFKRPEPITAHDEWRVKVIFQRHFQPDFSYEVLGRTIISGEVLLRVYRRDKGTFHSVGADSETHYFSLPEDRGAFVFNECPWSRLRNYLRGTPYKSCLNCGNEHCNPKACRWLPPLGKQSGWSEPTEPMPAIKPAKAS